MKIHLRRNPNTRRIDVWVSLDETLTRELTEVGESFIIANGDTRQAAARNAVKELRRHAKRLQSVSGR